MDGETALVGEVLRRAVIDLGSPRPDIQEDAQHFFADTERLTFWCSLDGIDADAFAARVERLQCLREAQ
jgi:hypothetical protein